MKVNDDGFQLPFGLQYKDSSSLLIPEYNSICGHKMLNSKARIWIVLVDDGAEKLRTISDAETGDFEDPCFGPSYYNIEEARAVYMVYKTLIKNGVLTSKITILTACTGLNVF